MEKEDLHILRLMGEIDRSGSLSQRELSRRLNISLGLVNTFIKRLVNKGYFKVTTMPKKRVKYFLTPAGLARKSRLTVEYLKYSIDSYKDIKKLLLKKYREMENNNMKSILFYGSGEVAELAYLYLQLTHKLNVDEVRKGLPFRTSSTFSLWVLLMKFEKANLFLIIKSPAWILSKRLIVTLSC